MWCETFLCFWGLFLSFSGLLDLGSFTSIAGGTTTSTCLECGGDRHHPSTKLDPPFLFTADGRGTPLNCLINGQGSKCFFDWGEFKKEFPMIDDE